MAERLRTALRRLGRRSRGWSSGITSDHRPVVVLAGLVSFVASVLGIVQWWATGPGGTEAPATSTTATTAPPTTARAAPPEHLVVDGTPVALTSDGDRIWVASESRSSGPDADEITVVTRIDAAGHVVERTEGRAGPVRDLVVAGDDLWLAQGPAGTVRLDPVTLDETGRVPVGEADGTAGPHVAVAAGADGAVWLVTVEGATGGVYRIDPGALVARRAGTVNGTPRAVAARGDAVWVAYGADKLMAFDVGTEPAEPRPPRTVGREIGALALGDDHVWVCDRGRGQAGTAIRLGVDADTVPTEAATGGCADLAPGSGSDVWVADDRGGRLVGLDGATARADGRPRRLGDEPMAVTTTPGTVWVALAGGEILAVAA